VQVGQRLRLVLGSPALRGKESPRHRSYLHRGHLREGQNLIGGKLMAALPRSPVRRFPVSSDHRRTPVGPAARARAAAHSWLAAAYVVATAYGLAPNDGIVAKGAIMENLVESSPMSTT
jgi:hypothetical protein